MNPVEIDSETPPVEERGGAPASSAEGLGRLEDELAQALELLRELRGELLVQTRVGGDLVRGALRRGLQRALAVALSVLLVATWTVAGAWALARGFLGSIAEGGPQGAAQADLIGGLALLGLVGLGLLLSRFLHDRWRLRRARDKYEPASEA